MIFELIGPAGVGKTTIASAIDAHFAAAALKVTSFKEHEILEQTRGVKAIMRRNPLVRAAILAPLFWRQPRLAFGISYLGVLHGPPLRSRVRKGQRLLAHCVFALELVRRHPDHIILHDGFTQTLWSFLIESRKLRGKRIIHVVLQRYFALVGQKAIRLDASDDEVVARVFARHSTSRFDRNTPTRRRNEFTRWLGYYRELIDLLPAELQVCAVDASLSPQQVTDAVAEIILKLSGRRPAASDQLDEFNSSGGKDWKQIST